MKKKRFISIVALSTVLGLGSIAGLASCQPNQGEVTDTKYKVTYTTSNDYTVAGLNAEGYAKGATVSFTVSVSNTKKEIDSVKVAGTALTGPNYSFTMPENDVAIVIVLKDKAVAPTKVLSATYTGTPKVGETIVVVGTLDGDPITGITVSVAEADATKVTITGTSVLCNEAGDITLKVAYVDGDKNYSFNLAVTIAGENLVTIKTALETAALQVPNYSESTPSSNYTTTIFTMKGKVVAMGDLYKDNTEFVIDDGTAQISVRYKGTPTFEVGDFIKVESALQNYFGLYSASSSSLVITELTEGEFTAADYVAFDGKAYDAYYDVCFAASTTVPSSTTYVPIKPVEVVAKFSDRKYFFIDGATKGNKGKLTLSKSPAATFTDLTLTKDTYYTIKGYLIGANTDSGQVNLMANSVAEKVYDATSIEISSEADAVDINGTLQINSTILPTEAIGNTLTWKSSDEAVAKVSATGLVTGLTAGTTVITATSGTTVSNSLTITVNANVAEANVSIDDGIVNGTLTANPADAIGATASPQEITLTATPDSGYEVNTVTVKVGDADAVAIKAETDGTYKYTTEDKGTYVFSATFKQVEVTALTDVKKADDSDTVFYRVQGVVTSLTSEGGSFYIQDINGVGIFVFGWTIPTDITVVKGTKLELYGYKHTNYSTIELCYKDGTSFTKVINDDTLTGAANSITSISDLKLTDVGTLYTFKAIYKAGDLSTYSSSKNLSLTLDLNGKDVTYYIKKSYASDTTVATKFSGIAIGDYVEFTAILGNYNTGLQFLYTSDATVAKATRPVVTSIVCVASETALNVGETTTLSSTVGPWAATNDGVVYSVLATSTGTATIDGSTLTATGVGVVSVVAKIGDVTSEAVDITISAAVALTGLTCVTDATSIEVGGTANLSATALPDGAVLTDAVTYEIATGSDFATISGAVVTGVAEGTVTVVAKSGTFTSQAVTITVTPAATKITKTIKELATANNWKDATKYSSASLDEKVSVTITGGSNTGKYYTSDDTWRMYQNETPSITILVPSGYVISKYTIVWKAKKTGTLTFNDSVVESGTEYVNTTASLVFGVGNSGTETNGQAQITSISISYLAA
jgi:hypothetical protein